MGGACENKTQHGAWGGELGEGVSGSIPDTILKFCSNSNWRDAGVFKMKFLPFSEASWNLRAIVFEEIFQKDLKPYPNIMLDILEESNDETAEGFGIRKGFFVLPKSGSKPFLREFRITCEKLMITWGEKLPQAATYDPMWQWPHATFNQFTVMVRNHKPHDFVKWPQVGEGWDWFNW